LFKLEICYLILIKISHFLSLFSMSILSIKHASPITLLKRLFHDLLLPYVQKKKPFVFITNHFSLYVSYYLTNWRLIPFLKNILVILIDYWKIDYC